MTIDGNDLINSILASLNRVEYVRPADIPNIDLYMDQVTTFMDNKLRASLRYPEEDKVLTKTMINNYAKNDLLPPPLKKKYSKEHILLLIFIYYYKGVLSINDIQTLFAPITERFFKNDSDFNLESIYKEAYQIGKEELEVLKADVAEKYKRTQEMFGDAPEEDKEYLKKFGFICALGYDVYMKKLMIEKLIDELVKEQESKNADSADKKKNQKKKD